MAHKGFICTNCGFGFGHNSMVDRTYDVEFTKPSEEDERKMIQVALADSRYNEFILSDEDGKVSIDHEKMADGNRALAEELFLQSRYNLELSNVETAYLSSETKFVEEYGTCTYCHKKGTLREVV